ncbi:hypothetical protein HPG69_018477 [Diceros bicornis minor]|uniref:Uncharacterized protein n=1 Tax=Diceros bicornis minor TaxID=77932 RepID=A0A7J7ERS3_DICBM|nr:hypothetical protein HPG69_018477 [Diceros bicornis minor]
MYVQVDLPGSDLDCCDPLILVKLELLEATEAEPEGVRDPEELLLATCCHLCSAENLLKPPEEYMGGCLQVKDQGQRLLGGQL